MNSRLANKEAFYQSSMFVSLRNILLKLVDGIHVNWNGCEELINNSNKKLVIVPVNANSNIDFLVLFYLNFMIFKT
jgi:hypothetical protein